MQYTCEICEKSFESLWGLSSHNVRKHSMKSEETYIKEVLNNIPPTCKCGCGESPSFKGIRVGFVDYILGHASRVNNNWGHNPEVVKKSHETQKRMYKSGELTIWNKGLTIEDPRVLDNVTKMLANPDRGKKISKALTGKKRPKEVMEKFQAGSDKYWSNPINRDKKRVDMSNFIKSYQKDHKSQLEVKFENILTLLGVNYIEQYQICSFNFDYYLLDYDTVIEIDGDFWHCNPIKYPNGPIYDSQRTTIKNDLKKNLICENTKGLKLLRFWETDINERPEWVITQLKQHIQPLIKS